MEARTKKRKGEKKFDIEAELVVKKEDE